MQTNEFLTLVTCLASSKQEQYFIPQLAPQKTTIKQLRNTISATGHSLIHFALSQETFKQLEGFSLVRKRTCRVIFYKLKQSGDEYMKRGIWILQDQETAQYKMKICVSSETGVNVIEITNDKSILGLLNTLVGVEKERIKDHLVQVFSYWLDRYYYDLSQHSELYIDVAQFKHNDYYILGTLKTLNSPNIIIEESAEHNIEGLQVIPNTRSKIAEGFACYLPALYESLAQANALPVSCFVDKAIQHFSVHPFADERKRDQEYLEFAQYESSQKQANEDTTSFEDRYVSVRYTMENDYSDDDVEVTIAPDTFKTVLEKPSSL